MLFRTVWACSQNKTGPMLGKSKPWGSMAISRCFFVMFANVRNRHLDAALSTSDSTELRRNQSRVRPPAVLLQAHYHGAPAIRLSWIETVLPRKEPKQNVYPRAPFICQEKHVPTSPRHPPQAPPHFPTARVPHITETHNRPHTILPVRSNFPSLQSW